MAITAIQGLPGAGKSYLAVNKLLVEFLQETNRPIYTNLPIELDTFLMAITDNVGKQERYRERINFLPERRGDFEKVRYVDPETKEETETEHDKLQEFWYFTKPNSIILLDELADIYGSDDMKENAKFRGILKSYINHHRHYKDDLYFFCQDRDDIDVVIRRKLQYVYVVRNSLKEQMIDHKLFEGLTWPFQFFIVNVYMGAKVLKMDALRTTKVKKERGFNLYPNKKGFANYRSFSKSAKIAGKALPEEGAVSSDCDPSIWRRLKNWSEQWSKIGAYLGAIAVFLYIGYRTLYGMLHTTSGDVMEWAGVTNGSAKAASTVSTNGVTNAVKVASTLIVTNDGVVSFYVLTNAPPEFEQVRLATPGKLLTTKGAYEIGSKIGSNTVKRILLNGLEFESGQRVRFDTLFAPGKAANL